MRGEQVAGEYLGRADVMVDGWFPTKDAGSLDADGYLYLEGRLDDVIVRGAENMSPGEIEDVLARHPAVADAGVVGVPDTEWGEKVVAAVVMAEGCVGVRGGAAGVGQGQPALVEGARPHRVPRGAALQRDRQAAAPGAEARAGGGVRIMKAAVSGWLAFRVDPLVIASWASIDQPEFGCRPRSGSAAGEGPAEVRPPRRRAASGLGR